ncbi:MAG: hypothetical protein IKQ43_07175 [Treponema sp.]|nr:hypothetical protein [Treponema sp.]
MKHIKSLLLLLLLPMAIFMTSCNNEVPEEFAVEIDPESLALYSLDDLDFFKINLDYYPNLNNVEEMPQPPETYPILDGEVLKKGDVLRLEEMKPGLYKLGGYMYNSNGDYIGSIKGKSNNMVWSNIEWAYLIVVEPEMPTIIKLVVSFTG